MSCLVILNELRRMFVWYLMSGNILQLETGLLWKAKIEWNRLACSLKFDITLPSGIGGILNILLLPRKQLRIDQEHLGADDV